MLQLVLQRRYIYLTRCMFKIHAEKNDDYDSAALYYLKRLTVSFKFFKNELKEAIVNLRREKKKSVQN